MKKIITITLFIFWAIVTAILTAGLLSYSNQQTREGSNMVSGNVVGNKPNIINSALTLNMTEVSKHNSSADCWMVISSKVYNVTSELSAHPGGAGTIIPYCGKDGTQAFASKDRQPGRDHSDAAYSSLVDYLIGNIGQKLSGQQYNSVIDQINTTSKNKINTSGREIEDD